MAEYAIYEKDKKNKRVTITFNRPEKLNAYDTKDNKELIEKIIKADEDDDIKIVIFKGSGKCFGSGFDVSNLGAHHGWGGPNDRRPSIRQRLLWDNRTTWGRRGLMQTILTCSKATIAQVHGYCYGGHHQMAVACDITIASEDAQFTHPGYRYIGPMAEIALFFHTMGVKKAKEMMLTGTPLSAQEALACGLVNRVVPLEKLDEEVNKMAGVIANQPADAIAMGKAFFEAAHDIIGDGTGYTVGYMTHTLQTNIRYEPDEFNLWAAKGKKGVKSALREREDHFKNARLSK
jgi:enoyl-CoA hydratase